MNNQEVWGKYEFYTGEITKHARYLGFVGIAICWFFKTPAVTFPDLILVAILLLVLFFLTDLLQYYVAAVRLRRWMYKEEVGREKETGTVQGEYWPPQSLDGPAFVIFRVKLCFLLLGFTGIGAELFRRFTLPE